MRVYKDSIFVPTACYLPAYNKPRHTAREILLSLFKTWYVTRKWGRLSLLLDIYISAFTRFFTHGRYTKN